MRQFLRRLQGSSSGVAMLEFALALPFLMTVGLFGIETANRAVMQMRINQIAVLIADDSSRVGMNSLLGEIRLYESDVNDIFQGAMIQGGKQFDLDKHGRIILSSLEVVADTEDQQFIHWQRCTGKLRHQSTYGEEGDGLASNMEGMGPPGEEIYAFPGEAVMFVEVAYQYQPIVTDIFDRDRSIVAIASFNVRNNRDLSQIYQRDPDDPDPVSNCDNFGI